MSRRERRELPLFDLPLHDDADDEADASPESPKRPAPTVEADTATSRVPSQSGLFDGLGVVGDLDRYRRDDSESEHDSERDPDTDDADRNLADHHVAVLDRLLGGLIDLAIHAGVLLLAAAASWFMGVALRLVDWPAFAAFLLLFSLLYTGVPLAFWGQTPGMMRVGHVARATSGEPLTFGQTALRWLGALLTVALAGLPLLLALGGEGSLADRLSGSRTEPQDPE